MCQTREQERIRRWLDQQFEPGQLRRAEFICNNAAIIQDASGDMARVVCRQNGEVSMWPVDEPA